MRNVFPTQIYRNRNKHCNGERERQKGEWKRRPKMRLGPERCTQIGLQFQTHVGCAQTYTLTVQHTDTYLYPSLSLERNPKMLIRDQQQQQKSK